MNGASCLVAVQVAVVDPLPLFRDGAVAALVAAGFAVQTPGDALTWVRQAPHAVMGLSVLGDADWRILAEAATISSAALSVVVMLEEESVAAGVRAVRGGAQSVLGRRASAEVLTRTVSAVIDGQSVMPAAVTGALVSGGGPDAGSVSLLPAERLSWLRALAAGRTVARLADEAGYSERAMYRLLSAVYRDMGVGGRVEALLRARDEGWL